MSTVGTVAKKKTKTVKKKRELQTIHRNIKRFREDRGLTPGELGAAADGDDTYVWHWENGDSIPNKVRLPLVAAALGVTIDDLFAEAS